MNLVDSCGWLEFFADGPNAEYFAAPIADRANLIVPTICILEACKIALQKRGEKEAQKIVSIMLKGHVVDLDSSIAVNAAIIGLEIGLPLADSVILATARKHNAIIWTQDADFSGIEGVQYIAK